MNKQNCANDFLLGIDIGTGSAKVALMDTAGNLAGIEKYAYSVEFPKDGWAELPVEDVWIGLIPKIRELLRNAKEEARRVRAIGISTLCPGLTPMDERGRALAPSILYMDTRSLEETELVKQKIPEDKWFTITGNTLMPGATSVTSMLWFKRRRPEIHASTVVYGHLNTLVGKKLTGRFGIDPSNASYTGLFQITGGESWSKYIISALDFEEDKLPPLIPAWHNLGGLTETNLIKCGLRIGIPVAIGGGDTACASLAVGVVEHNQVFESAGTSNVITICSEIPRFDQRFMNRCHVVPGRWLYHGAMSSTGASVRWLRDEIFKLEKDEEYKSIAMMALTPQPEDPCPIFLPYMMGERSPVWDPKARGILFGLSLSTTREHLVRAVFEGCAYGIRQLLEFGEEVTGNSIQYIPSIGGWSAIDSWMQIKADITGRNFHAMEISEAAVMGAALLGGIASGVICSYKEASSLIHKQVRKFFKPTAIKRLFYDNRYKIYKSLYPRLKDLFS